MSRSLNPSLRAPLLDLIAAILLIAVSGAVWLRVEGRAQVGAARNEMLSARLEDSREIAGTQVSLNDAYRELQGAQQMQHVRAQHHDYLAARIAEEESRIDRARERDEPLAQSLQVLEAEIVSMRRRRSSLVAEIGVSEAAFEEQRGERVRLEALAEMRAHEVADAEQRLASPPPSRFPAMSGIDLRFEKRDAGGFGLVAFSRTLYALGPLNAGLLGALGLQTGGGDALFEGAAFLNLSILPGRLSLDLGGGSSRLQARHGDAARTEGFASASLRFAPLAHERIHLLAGLRRGAREGSTLRFGVGFGRR